MAVTAARHRDSHRRLQVRCYPKKKRIDLCAPRFGSLDGKGMPHVLKYDMLTLMEQRREPLR